MKNVAIFLWRKSDGKSKPDYKNLILVGETGPTQPEAATRRLEIILDSVDYYPADRARPGCSGS
ncbi:MAG: hypothetical protein H5U05_08060 [Candidatus Aminicenantes bacterium]|nr:hypothetical protein [Candidatus Aminicenantes bacterium]